jgi:multidrug efflux system outer membrane protein
MLDRLPLRASLALVATLVAGCSSIPAPRPYERPTLNMPAQGPAVNPQALQSWWTLFKDPVLDGLMAEATAHSQDLKLAAARVAEAQALLDQNQVNFLPTVDLNASASRRRTSENSGGFSAAAGAYANDKQLGLTASYELDFWGRYARADDAARARLLAQSASQATVRQTLWANVAQAYFSLRAVDAQLELAQQTLTTREANVRLQGQRFKAGSIGELDLRQAEAEAAGVQANLLQLQQARANTESALSLLLGRSPAAIAKPSVARGASVAVLVGQAVVPSALPSDVLNQRPDLAGAEQALIAANADVAQARTAYFPRLSLTATLGQQSRDLSDLLKPASLFWNLLGNLTQPVFRAGSIDALVAAANAREQQALAQYTQAVQAAFRDVHDALNNASASADVARVTTQRIEALRTGARLVDLRYQSGYSGYVEVLNNQRDLAQAESLLVDARKGQLLAQVALFKALGGGWVAEGK